MPEINDQNFLDELFIDEAKMALDRHDSTETNVIPLEVTENGVYETPPGVDGYSSVTVNVAAINATSEIIDDILYITKLEA